MKSELMDWGLAECTGCPWRHIHGGGDVPKVCPECGTPWTFRWVTLPQRVYRSFDDLLHDVLGAFDSRYSPRDVSFAVVFPQEPPVDPYDPFKP